LAWRWKKSLGLADFAGLLAWRQFRSRLSEAQSTGPVRGLPVALPFISGAIFWEDREQ
jgi:hypothetical protein